MGQATFPGDSTRRINSNLYDDLGPTRTTSIVRRVTTSQKSRKMQIEIAPLPPRSISDDKPRKAPSPPNVPPALSLRSMSQTTLIQDEATPREKDKFHILQFPKVPETATAASELEVALLRTKVESLELRLAELQSALHILQWHSDPQRQAALEDWAIERIVSIYNQYFPQTKETTISELIRLFAASKQKTCLTTVELEHLRTLPRTRDVLVRDFMVIPSWFSQNMEKDVKEIARYVAKMRDPEAKKLNARLYKFATTRSPKADAKPSRVVHIGNNGGGV